MKKRTLVLLTATVLTMSMAACGNKNNNTDLNTENNTQNTVVDNTEDLQDTTVDTPVADTATVKVLADVWATYGEEEKFAVIGGSMETPVDNAPGAYSLENKEGLTGSFNVPAEALELVDEAATMMHMMNANTFSAAAFHLTDAANAETFATKTKDTVMSAQWMCGFPEKLVIVTVNDEYVISAYGNGEAIENLKNKVTAVYGEKAVVLAAEDITE